MLALAEAKTDKPHNVISITRHACFKKTAPATRDESPVEFVCHELLKPLAVINHSARLLGEMPLGDTEKGLVDKIAMSCNTAMQYSRATQNAARLSRLMMNSRDFRPAELAAELIGAVADFAHLNGADVVAEVARTVPEVLLAPDQKIAQLLGVFLNNAIKHARGQTINLSVSGKPGPADFLAVFRVETRMPAMTDAAIDKITTFQAANAHIAALFCGRGVGMAACKGQAARIGGHITVSSAAANTVAIELAMSCKLPKTYAEPLLLV